MFVGFKFRGIFYYKQPFESEINTTYIFLDQ
jgi:hypothetical protein